MKTKRNTKSNEKTMVISVGHVAKMGMNIFGKVMKTADEVKRSKLTIKLEKE